MTSKHSVVTFFTLVVLVTVFGSSLRVADPTTALTSTTSASSYSAIMVAQVVTPTLTLTPLPTETPTVTPTPTITPTPTVTRTRAPTATATPAPRVIRVPILMYHYVGVPPADADKYRLDLTVTPDAFETQLDYLAINGFQPIRLIDLVNYLNGGPRLPEKPIVLTFDDGYADNYTNAFASLRNKNFPATFFVVTKFIDENRWGYMNWAQLAEMVQAGMEIGSHSVDHPDLYRKSKTVQTKQVVESKKMIESRLPVTVLTFSYPSSRYDSNTISALRAAGYLASVTETQGARHSSADLFQLDRIRIRGSYAIADFARWIKWYTENSK